MTDYILNFDIFSQNVLSWLNGMTLISIESYLTIIFQKFHWMINKRILTVSLTLLTRYHIKRDK